MKNVQFVSTAWFVEKIAGDSELEKRWQIDLTAKF